MFVLNEDGTEIYILGNPPYLGSGMQSKKQKEDMTIVFDGIKGYKNLDYIACWFLIGSKYIQSFNSQFAFVSTNSICQGQQVAMLWSHVFSMDLEIGFSHQSFKWTNNARGNAGVACIVVGLRNESNDHKLLFNSGIKQTVKNINAYLASGSDLIILKRSKPISCLPIMTYGNKSADGGHLILSSQEKKQLIENHPDSRVFIKKLKGSSKFIRGHDRFCLWIEDKDLRVARNIEGINRRIEDVIAFRLASKKTATQNKAEVAHRFAETRYGEQNSLIIPRLSSDRRDYIPIGFLEKDTIILDRAFAIYDPEPWVFSIISSCMHITWVRAVAGRLKMDYNYSSSLCYNTFPFPDISEVQKTTLEDHVFKVLDKREQHPEKTMAQLYDPDKMPDSLSQAHHEMDLAVE